MVMDEHYHLGRKVTLILYAAMGPYVVGSCLLSNNIPYIAVLLLAAFWIVSGVGCLLIKDKQVYCYLMLISVAVFGSAICFAEGSVYALMSLFTIQWLGGIFFLQLDICWLVMIVQIISVSLATFLNSDNLWSITTMVAYVSSILVVIVSFVVTRKLISLLLNEITVNADNAREREVLLKELEVRFSEAQEASKSKSEFLANMSHEIRTPINAIIGFNEVALRECRQEEMLEYLNSISTASSSLLAIISDVLDFSAIESGNVQLVESAYSIEEVVRRAAKINAVRARNKNLSLKFRIAPETPTGLRGDSMRLGQIMNNLISNGLKYTKEGGVTVSVWTQPAGEPGRVELYIEVKDTGSGIRPEDMPKLFQSFQRLDLETNRTIEGTGLGLPLTMELVKKMGGDITANSIYGLGSVFCAHFPQFVENDAPVGEHFDIHEQIKVGCGTYRSLFTAPKAKVLVVDDNILNLTVISNLLKPTEVQVTLCSGGQECLEHMCSERYDIILLDHMMPNIDGIEVLKRSKTMEGNLCEGVPIIAMTANAVSGARQQYYDAGFNGYLSKPIVGRNLERTMLAFMPKELVESVLEEDEEPDEEENEGNEAEAPVQDVQAEAPSEQSDTDSVVINRKTGLSFCADSVDVYNEALTIYCEDGPDTIKTLQNALNANDWDNYLIRVHALKSASMTIGASEFGARAARQEAAVKEKRLDNVRADHVLLIKEYRAVLEKVDTMIKQ